ncbi:MAG TPA: hypothetical protein VKV05_06210 [Terriglobales bacterium]|nr:hypothetical protein [Terriglobales bacterium]
MPPNIPETRKIVWRWVLAATILLGVYGVVFRRIVGWGAQARLREIFPWGFCSGLDVFCGLALAAGGFSIAATLYVADLRSYKTVLRISLLIGFLGFLGAPLATMANRPFHFWYFVQLWNPGTPFLGLAGALLLYSLLLSVEFAYPSPSKAAAQDPSPLLRVTRSALALCAALLAILQQASLARPILQVPGAFSRLWLTPMFSAQLFLSAVAGSLAMVIFAWRHLPAPAHAKAQAFPIARIKEVLLIVLSLYLTMRLVDLIDRQTIPLLFQARFQNYLLGIELCLFLLPTLLLIRWYQELTDQFLYRISVLVLAGMVTNRLNISITAREAVKGILYVPRWTDLFIAYGVIALCIALFGLAAHYLPIFAPAVLEDREPSAQPEVAHSKR